MSTKSKQYLLADEQDDSSSGGGTLAELKAFKVILSNAKEYRWRFIFGLAVMLLSALCAIGTAKVTGLLVDDGLLAKNTNQTIIWAIAIIAFEITTFSSHWFGRRLLAYASSKTIYTIRKVLFNHLQNLPLGFYDRQPQGRVVTRVTHDVEQMESFFLKPWGGCSTLFLPPPWP